MFLQKKKVDRRARWVVWTFRQDLDLEIGELWVWKAKIVSWHVHCSCNLFSMVSAVICLLLEKGEMMKYWSNSLGNWILLYHCVSYSTSYVIVVCSVNYLAVFLFMTQITHTGCFFSFLLHSVWCWNKMICLVKGSWTKKTHHNPLDNDRLLKCTAAVCSLLCSVSVSLIPFYKSHLFSDTQTQIWKILYKACHFLYQINKYRFVCAIWSKLQSNMFYASSFEGGLSQTWFFLKIIEW